MASTSQVRPSPGLSVMTVRFIPFRSEVMPDGVTVIPLPQRTSSFRCDEV